MSKRPSLKCKSLTLAGKPCNALACRGSDYCIFHDPKRTAELKAYQSLGGQRSHKPAINSALDALQRLEISLLKIAQIIKTLEEIQNQNA